MMLQAVCFSVSLVLVVVQCQVLNFTRQLTPNDVYCGHLRCVANSSQTITNIAIYDVTEKGNSVKLASIFLFKPEVTVDPSKDHVINATGTITKYDGVLDVRFLRDVDCLYGVFQCELDFFDINGQPVVITKTLAPASEENATIVYSLVQITAMLKEHAEDTDKQLGALKHDNDVLKADMGILKQDNEVLKQDTGILKQDNQVLKQDNEALKTVLVSILMTVSNIDEILNSTLDKDQQLGSLCYRGIPHKSPREKFVLQGKIMALCDTETDGGGWVIIQRRVQGDVDFYRGWNDYKRGFGTPDTDFWLGNDIIHNLTSQGYNELRIDFIYKETEYFAQYTNFIEADESSAYAITIGGYSGNVYDAMSYHNGNKFTTFDRDNDLRDNQNCAEEFHGAWWYNNCYNSNLNGAWADADSTGIAWNFNLNAQWNNISFTEMKIRKN